MNNQAKFATFAALHVPGDPVVLYNIWDVGSAQAVVAAGAKALATGSHPVGDASGFGDGHQVPLDFVFANAARIVEAVDPLPLTVDFEGAYSADPEAGGRNVARLAETGAVGCNFEDQVIGGEGVHPLDLQMPPDRGDPPGGRRCLLHQCPDRPVPEGGKRMTTALVGQVDRARQGFRRCRRERLLRSPAGRSAAGRTGGPRGAAAAQR